MFVSGHIVNHHGLVFILTSIARDRPLLGLSSTVFLPFTYEVLPFYSRLIEYYIKKVEI